MTTAKIAGIMAAKKTGELIPLCHPLELTGIDINLNIDHKNSQIVIDAQVQTTGKNRRGNGGADSSERCCSDHL